MHRNGAQLGDRREDGSMNRKKTLEVVLGILALASIPLGIWVFNQYMYAEPGITDSFALGEGGPRCTPVESGGYVLQIPIVPKTKWDTISRITLWEPRNLLIERAGLLPVGEAMRDGFAAADLAELVPAGDGWFRLGEVNPQGQILALLINTDSSPAYESLRGYAAGIDVATYGGETRWKARLPLSPAINNGFCTFSTYELPTP